MKYFESPIPALGTEGELVPILVVIMVIFSTALFGLILPKFFDSISNRYRDELKNALDIDKALKEKYGVNDSEQYPDAKLDEVIEHYCKRYLEQRLTMIKRKSPGDKMELQMGGYALTFLVVLFVAIIAIAAFVSLLGIIAIWQWMG